MQAQKPNRTARAASFNPLAIGSTFQIIYPSGRNRNRRGRFNPLAIGSTFQIDEVEATAAILISGFNPLAIGSTFQMSGEDPGAC